MHVKGLSESVHCISIHTQPCAWEATLFLCAAARLQKRCKSTESGLVSIFERPKSKGGALRIYSSRSNLGHRRLTGMITLDRAESTLHLLEGVFLVCVWAIVMPCTFRSNIFMRFIVGYFILRMNTERLCPCCVIRAKMHFLSNEYSQLTTAGSWQQSVSFRSVVKKYGYKIS